MNPERIIPITPIMGRYRQLRTMSQHDRLRQAKHLVKHPEELATEFAASIAHFEPYKNIADHFYPPRLDPKISEDVKCTNDLVLRLKAQPTVVPVDSPTRRREHEAGPVVTAVPASRLACDYVDRELLVQRTTSPGEWEDGTRNRGGLRLDVLLADAADRTPIVGELKLPGDMDPFFALIQGLACAAHLATANQYDRMQKHLGRGEFPDLPGAPRVDVWVLTVDGPAHDPKGSQPKYMGDLKAAAERLAPKLLAEDSIAASLRRIAGVGMKLDDSGAVAADVRWAWERTG
jgi:hypothetical protein